MRPKFPVVSCCRFLFVVAVLVFVSVLFSFFFGFDSVGACETAATLDGGGGPKRTNEETAKQTAHKQRGMEETKTKTKRKKTNEQQRKKERRGRLEDTPTTQQEVEERKRNQ